MSQPRPGSALSPNPAAKNALLGLSADSPADAWAVGVYNKIAHGDSEAALALHWNGTTWLRAKSPSPSAGDNELNAVTALSPTDAWAVGEFDNTNGRTSTLILHWNGITWSRT